jgi:protein-tyrosine phosphatase
MVTAADSGVQKKRKPLIDLHCHILPGLDDGPQDVAESVEMAACALKDGIHTIVATPHTSNGVYHNSLNTIQKRCRQLEKTFQAKQIPMHICPGAEIRIHKGMEQLISAGELATINNTGQYVLVEFPHDRVLPGTQETLDRLLASGITPILAHPERNPALQRNPDLLADWVSKGCLVQLTAMSITGELGKAAKAYSHFLLTHQQAQIIASDAHDAVSRPPILSRAVDMTADLLGDTAAADAMVKANPRKIIEGKPLHPPAPLKGSFKKRWWQIS